MAQLEAFSPEPMLDKKILDQYGQDYFVHRSDPKRDVAYRQEYARLLELTALVGGKVLDIGCGTGEFLDLFPNDAWAKYGIDVSEYAVAISKQKGVSFDVPHEPQIFDLIILRGSLQHLDRPTDILFKAHQWLRSGGWLVVLATPNAGGIVYRLWQDLPALAPERNFVVFSDKVLRQCLLNIGYRDVKLVYPYLDSPYASPVRDHLLFALRFLGYKRKFPFWRNMMECYAQK